MKNIKEAFGLFKNILKFLFSDKKNRRVSVGIIFLIFILAGIFYYLKNDGRVSIEDSLVQAPIIDITAQTPGNLNEVDVVENQNVKKGDLLAVAGTLPLKAQTDGIIIAVNKQIGALVTPQTNVVAMINPDDFRVVGTLDENKGLKDIKTGQVASFSVDAFSGQTFWGFVDEVSPTAKQTQSAFSISNERPTQQFNIYVRFDASKYPQIKNGMSAKLIIYTKTN